MYIQSIVLFAKLSIICLRFAFSGVQLQSSTLARDIKYSSKSTNLREQGLVKCRFLTFLKSSFSGKSKKNEWISVHLTAASAGFALSSHTCSAIKTANDLNIPMDIMLVYPYKCCNELMTYTPCRICLGHRTRGNLQPLLSKSGRGKLPLDSRPVSPAVLWLSILKFQIQYSFTYTDPV